MKVSGLKVADEVWVATVLLHREHPERSGFAKHEIVECANRLHPGTPCRPGVVTHIAQHCVASLEPNPGRYRILCRNTDGTYRLFRDGDAFHPRRIGAKNAPKRQELPEGYRDLLDWYESDYSPQRPSSLEEDPLMRLKGLGKDVWRSLGGGDAVIRWLRSDESSAPPWEQGVEGKKSPRREDQPILSSGVSR